jgi:peptidoglycan/LPS O-acetylase OafA/YrhL
MNAQTPPISLEAPRIWIKPYYKAFNGLRGVAILMVFFCHDPLRFHPIPQQQVGWTGVDLFFVLSGFLITGILYDTLNDKRYFRNFYIRRALRIFPLFYAMFLLLFVLTPVLHLHYVPGLFAFVFYFGNYLVPYADLVHRNPTVIYFVHHGRWISPSNIGAFWSLCVEEQFYLLWPMVVWLVRDRRRLMQICAAVIVAEPFLRGYILAHSSVEHVNKFLIQWSMLTRCDTLLIGAWLALWLRHNALTVTALRRLGAALMIVSTAIMAAGMIATRHHHGWMTNPFLVTVGYTFIALAYAGLLLLALNEHGAVSRLLQLRWLSAMGLISYGFYLLQGWLLTDWIFVTGPYAELQAFNPLIHFAVTLVAAVLSFRYLEMPFLRMKNVLAPQGKHGHVSTPGAEILEPAR